MLMKVKDYEQFFGVNRRTASKMLREDKERKNVSAISIYMFAEMYAAPTLLLGMQQKSVEKCVPAYKVKAWLFG